jgi:hypothetical protein
MQYTQYRARICKCIWSPGTDSEESISPASVVWRAGTTNRVVVPARQARESIPGLLQRLTNTGSVRKGNKEEEFLLSSLFGPLHSPPVLSAETATLASPLSLCLSTLCIAGTCSPILACGGGGGAKS